MGRALPPLLATPKSAKHKVLKMQVKTEHRHIQVAHRFSPAPPLIRQPWHFPRLSPPSAGAVIAHWPCPSAGTVTIFKVAPKTWPTKCLTFG